ncbi:MAG: TIGR01212 family radical SAM protein [Pseudomonadota bacterium]
MYKVSLESGLSCPNRDGTIGKSGCIFCNLESYNPAASPEGRPADAPIASQLDEGMRYIRRRHGAEKCIAYFQRGSNTHAPASSLTPLFAEALAHPAVSGLAVSTRPDCIGPDHVEMFEYLSRSKLLWVELGLQSAHDATLSRIGRGHTAAQFASACRALQDAGICVCAHVILGLPDETAGMMLDTARFLNETGVWGVKIHNLHVLRETRLEELYRSGEIALTPLEIYAGWVADFLEELSPNIVVHRVNGHSPRNLTVAPEWSVNKLAIFNEVEKELEKRDTRQGKNFIWRANNHNDNIRQNRPV